METTLRELALQYYQLIVMEKRLFSDPEVIENQKKYQQLILKQELK